MSDTQERETTESMLASELGGRSLRPGAAAFLASQWAPELPDGTSRAVVKAVVDARLKGHDVQWAIQAPSERDQGQSQGESEASPLRGVSKAEFDRLVADAPDLAHFVLNSPRSPVANSSGLQIERL